MIEKENEIMDIKERRFIKENVQYEEKLETAKRLIRYTDVSSEIIKIATELDDYQIASLYKEVYIEDNSFELEHNGYSGSYYFNEDKHCYYGSLDSDNSWIFTAMTLGELYDRFVETVEDYICYLKKVKEDE